MLRSLLFVPADRPDRFVKALNSGADAIIIDLEDAVAVSKKVQSRRDLLQAVPSTEDRPVPIYLRVNAVGTKWCLDDLRAAAEIKVDGVFAPKCSSASDVNCVSWAMMQLGFVDRELIPIVETGAGILRAHDIMSTRTIGLRVNFGAGDLSHDLSLDLSRDETELSSYRAHVVAAARTANAPAPLDTVWAHLDDNTGLEESAKRAKRMGFGGKLCIHPSQVSIINAAFSPTDKEVSYAREVCDAFEEAEAAGNAAIRVRGDFVDYPILYKAQAVLRLHQTIVEREIQRG